MAAALSKPLFVFGGTFDPVHNGHLRTAIELTELFRTVAEVRLIPCGDPKHRQAPLASALHRLAMLRAATRHVPNLASGQPMIQVDDREVKREGATYTIDTLLEIRRQVGQQPLILVMGSDAFLQLPSWHRWLEIIKAAHIMVVRRPNWSIADDHEVARFYRNNLTNNLTDLITCPAGKIGQCELTQLDISATVIRRLFASGSSPRYLLPESVLDYVITHQLYGVSSHAARENSITEADTKLTSNLTNTSMRPYGD